MTGAGELVSGDGVGISVGLLGFFCVTRLEIVLASRKRLRQGFRLVGVIWITGE